jgi:magnesium chelatase subunit D
LHRDDIVFPFTAVVGQEQVKQALLLNAVSHEVGGVLIRGRRGTAKSTLARAVAYLLPEIQVVTDCPFSCDPGDIESLCGYCAGLLALEGTLPSSRTRMRIVTLPLNATEEMVVGTLDIEKALRQGEKSFEPGILARANRSLLYVDEVNLLEDHLVDVLLDSAAMGVNVVEREGISFRHGAGFVLIGTMNPEEGDLRPQLEDRFGLCAEVDVEVSAAERAEILRRNLQFKKNPVEFEARWHSSQEALRVKLLAAREAYPAIETPDKVLDAVARLVESAGADGHRADIAMVNAARAVAALDGLEEVRIEHLSNVAGLALNHRVRREPLGSDGGQKLDVAALMSGVLGDATSGAASAGENPDRAAGWGQRRTAQKAAAVQEAAPADPKTAFEDTSLPDREANGAAPGKRGKQLAADSRGRYYRSAVPSGDRNAFSPSDIAFDATIRASATRGGGNDGKPDVLPEDIRVKLRKRKCGASIVFVVDASASMGAMKRLEAARQAIFALLVEAYQKRDRVGLVVFKDDAAQLVMSPTSSKALATRLLGELSPGGTTPLSHGLTLGRKVLEREIARTPRPFPVLVLISDGGGNVTMGSSDPMKEALEIGRDIRERGIYSVILDSAPNSSLTGRPSPAWRLADAMGGSYFPAYNMSGAAILDKVDRSIAREPASLPRAPR